MGVLLPWRPCCISTSNLVEQCAGNSGHSVWGVARAVCYGLVFFLARISHDFSVGCVHTAVMVCAQVCSVQGRPRRQREMPVRRINSCMLCLTLPLRCQQVMPVRCNTSCTPCSCLPSSLALLPLSEFLNTLDVFLDGLFSSSHAHFALSAWPFVGVNDAQMCPRRI